MSNTEVESTLCGCCIIPVYHCRSSSAVGAAWCTWYILVRLVQFGVERRVSCGPVFRNMRQ
jgi:hypothetical protein